MASIVQDLETLPAGHPCSRCAVRGQALCSVLGWETLAEFKRLGPTLRLGAGQTLFREGDPVTRVFTLTRGSVKLYKLLLDGRRQIVGFAFAGDFLGITLNDEHAFTADLIEDGELCSFSHDRFANFIAERPTMERELYRLAAHELGAAQRQLVILGRQSASQRLASLLLLLADRTRWPKGRTVKLPMSRSDIADYLGLTKETVSRVFSAFRAERMIRLQTLHEVEILDRAALERAAES